MGHKQIAVIGGGIAGVCAAYFLAEAGHDVALIERRATVAQESSFAQAGSLTPAASLPFTLSGAPKTLLGYLLQQGLMAKAAWDRSLRRWLRHWLEESRLERYQVHQERMQRIASYSRSILLEKEERFALDWQQTSGRLQLFRTEAELAVANRLSELLTANDVSHHLINPDAARSIEPALASHMPLAGGLYLPNDLSGNCPLFAKRLRHIAADLGVRFHFGGTVKALAPRGGRVSVRMNDTDFHADAVVIAAGAGSLALLAPLGVRVPLRPLQAYSASVAIRDYDAAPLAALTDAASGVTISRIGSRLRLTEAMAPGADAPGTRERARQLLAKIGADWFPGAANYSEIAMWSGLRAMLPDGVPLVGATPIPNVYLSVAHDTAGWATAAGSGKLIADIISGRIPEINMEGLTLARYG